MKKLLLLSSLLCMPGFAGQSLQLNGTKVVENNAVQAQGANAACRMEFAVHDWDNPPNTGRMASVPACGWILAMSPDRFEIYPERTLPGWSCCANGQILLGSFSTKFAVIRAQIIPSGAGGTFLLEAWDATGSRVFIRETSYTITSGTNSSGAVLGGDFGSPPTIKWGYFRLFSSTVPGNSRPPVFADVGNLLEWKFENNLNDSSGRGNNGHLSTGSPAYSSTPNQQLVIASASTVGAPSWNNWISARAGYPLTLSGSRSFSWSDTDANVSCLWQVTRSPAGVGLPKLNNRQSCAPVVTGLVFGTYTFRLTAISGTVRVNSDLTMGAVSYDEHGVVIQADPTVDILFGPMVAFGQNPWGLADERSFAALNVRHADYSVTGSDGYSAANPSWDAPQPGTVSYIFGGNVNASAGGTCTTLSGATSSTGTSFTVTNAGCLDLTNLPTRIMITSGNFSFSFEEVCIASASATTGPATLTVCYDGRGVDDASGMGQVLGPTNWPAGAFVGQQMVTGTGTTFAGPGGTFCPAGAPGPAGVITYSAGTIALTAGSATATGTATSWSNANGVQVGQALRVAATHGGTPFVFTAYVAAINSPTQLTLSRIFPPTADAASGVSYALVDPFARFAALHFTRQGDGSDAMANWTATACESNTRLYLNTAISGHDIDGYKGTLFSGQQYSYGYPGYINQSNTGGLNFYGESLAHRALYLRSGYSKAHEAANMLDDHWVRYPGERGGVVGAGSPLVRGGGVIAAIACLVTDPTCKIGWTDVRGYVQQGANTAASITCLDWDSRDGGYLGAWLTLGALFDPDTSPGGYRQQWRTALTLWEIRDQTCKRSDFSFANQAQYFNPFGPSISLTNGSETGTGTDLAAGICAGIAKGQATVTNGSAAITATSGTFDMAAGGIILNGVKNGNPFSAHYQFLRTGATTGTMSVLWPGLTGSVTFMTTDGSQDAATVFGTSNTDSDLAFQYGCIRNSSTQITLDRPWKGDNAPHHLYRFPGTGASGFGQQPFLASINSLHLNWAAYLDSTLGTGFAAMRNGAANWIHDVGYDSELHGVHYARAFQFAESTGAGVAGFAWKVPGATYGSGQITVSRAVAGEIQPALRFYYLAKNGSAEALSWGDTVYGGIWGNCALTKPGYPCDQNFVQGENSNNSFHMGKWTGFFFGVGMAHQWPAVRAGGVQPPRNRTVSVGNSQPLGVSAQVVVTAPSGAVSTISCGATLCQFTVDDRQGTHWYKIQYLSATQQVVSESDPELLNPAPAL